jgi:hypothetical protein
MLDAPPITTKRATRRALLAASGAAGAVLILVLSLLAGVGWLYLLRSLGWFTLGPRLGDSLPLLRLAGFDGQPLVRVAVAWLLAGIVFGLALIRVDPWRRAVLGGVLGLLLLLFASQAAFALAGNLRLSAVLWDRVPGFGPWCEALLFAAGSALPRRIAKLERSRSRVVLFRARTAVHDLLLGSRQHGNAGEDKRDRHEVDGDRGGASP